MAMNDIDIFHIPQNRNEIDRDMTNYNLPMDYNNWVVDRSLAEETEQ
jgi:hypothetical protein